MTLHRRTNKVSGYVDFPVTSSIYKSSGEGGLFVQLWVVPNKKDWMMCCGGYGVNATYCESLVGTDKVRNNDNFNEMSKNKDVRQRFPLEEKLFPRMHDVNIIDDYQSIDLYACITMGSTGWSGYNDRKGMWRCKFYDLTRDGKFIYNSMKALYGNKAKLLLVTWLDT